MTSTALPGRRPIDRVAAAAAWAARVRAAMPRPIRWLLADPRRMLTLAWLIGLLIAGCARSALADTIIVGPDLAHGAPKTLFESYDFLDYTLTVKPSDEASGWFDVNAGIYQLLGFLNNLILWIALGVLYGSLALLEWLLNLTIYRDSADQIDTATQMIASSVFWPLIAATVAVGAFMAYARWRSDGRGFLTDLGWVVAAAAIAAGFASGPSTIMNQVDSVRQDVAAGIIAGSTQYANVAGNPTGFPEPQITGAPQETGTRKLVNSVWNTFGATSWCYAEFHEIGICQVAGSHALADDDQWKKWMQTLDDQAVVPEFREWGDWVRGQDPKRIGYVMLLALIAIPMALLLLRLVVAGLVAVVGLLLMLVIGLVFLAFWPIPGGFRQAGTRYWIYTLGLELQGMFITVVVAGTTVVSVMITTQVGKYGYFLVAVLNLVLFYAAVKARSWLELLTTTGGASSMGLGSYLIMRSVARTVMTIGAGVASGGTSMLAGAGRLLNARGRGPGWGRQPNATSMMIGTRRYSKPRDTGRLSALGGPIRATATRAPGAGTRPGLAGPPATALSPAPRGGLPGGTRPGGTAGPGRGLPAGRPTSAAPPPVTDPKLPRNVREAQQRTGRTGRVWVDRRGSGLSRLDQSVVPDPPSAGRGRGGAYRITTVRSKGRRR